MTDGIDRDRPLTIVPQEDYASSDFARLEKERMWPKVWQMACRVEQLPKVGDQILYEICDESIIIVRSSEDRISAFHNACSHRGRMLTTEARRSREFVCPFHGWRFNLEGKCTHIPYKEDWGNLLDGVDTSLSRVQCDTWGGWVMINMDLDAPPLGEYLAEAGERLAPLRIDEQRIRWYSAVEMDGNWKVVLEAFNEGYHVQTTHPQFLPTFDEYADCHGVGMHGVMNVFSMMGQPSRILNQPPARDVRPVLLEFMRQNAMDITSVFSERDLTAACRIMEELPADVSLEEANMAVMQYRRDAAITAGVGWPEMTMEQLQDAAALWHIFPNFVVLTGATASLWYRFRPLGRGDNPEKSLFEIYALERYPDGYSPNVVNHYYDNWEDYIDLPPFLAQDFSNLPHMQKGIRSSGFRGAILNPVQEGIVANFHRQLWKLLGKDNG